MNNIESQAWTDFVDYALDLCKKNGVNPENIISLNPPKPSLFMNEKIRYYFRLFGNPDEPEKGYWEKDPNLFQVLFGILVAPIALVIFIFFKVLSITIRL